VNQTGYAYANARFVDPINGDDAAEGDGADITAPLRTIAAALASISSPSSSNRYTIWLFPGGTTEANPIVWRSWVNLVGYAGASTVSQSVRYTGGVNENATFTFSGVVLAGELRILTSQAVSAQVVIRDSTLASLYVDGGDTVLRTNDVFLYSSTIQGGTTIADGTVRTHATTFAGLILLNTKVTTFAGLQVMAGRILTNLTSFGQAYLLTFGTQTTAYVKAVTPDPTSQYLYWETDQSSLPWVNVFPPFPFSTSRPVSGQVWIDDRDHNFASPSSNPFYVTFEDYVMVEAVSGPSSTVVLPTPDGPFAGQPLQNRFMVSEREIVVKKISGSFNVTVIGGGKTGTNGARIDGFDSYTIQRVNEFAAFAALGGMWRVVRQGLGGRLFTP
jgi:hypothetical protein